MANININTQGAQYQNALDTLRQIKALYGPRVVDFLQEPRDRQKIWVQYDPLMWEILDLVRRANEVDTGDLLD